ncbi:hypothetical protein A9F13_04g01661 [Clavispora lusitaniae]|uniref:Uncharacterized protein n=1 Tax=Clavispora lusitaniae TaxID=36911 RepID=A0AA91Q1K5_CLALS|nr:hypothetical protein A9F13_04g01661 [Clavispora lusitaniae]
MHWPSSPTRPLDSLDGVEENQKARAAALYHPLSSPLSNKAGTREEKKRTEMIKARDQLRQQRLVLGRERTSERESYAQQMELLRLQAAALDMDPDDWDRETEQVEADLDEAYEAELEEYMLQEELELEQQLRELQLNETAKGD